MATIATNYADWTILTSDNPRTESPMEILNDMTAELSAVNYEVIESRKQAIEQAINYATSGDVILIAGKGHETYKEVHDVRYDIDERLIAKENMLHKWK